jgi:hypothetical protein
MFMCVVNLESVNKLDLTWKQSFLIYGYLVLAQENDFDQKQVLFNE